MMELLEQKTQQDPQFNGVRPSDAGLGKAIGLSSATVSAIRNEKIKDYAATSLIALRRYLGMTIDDILGLDHLPSAVEEAVKRALRASSKPPESSSRPSQRPTLSHKK